MNTRTDTEPTPLRRLRLARGVSQKSLAATADCSISTVWLAEKGGFLSERMAKRFADALGVAVEELRP
jgi:transcriptional regulator with XRE-family HTH domain